MSKRHDHFTGKTVIIAEGRQDRPIDWETDDLALTVAEQQTTERKDCPFCRGQEHLTETPRLALDASGGRLDDEASDWATRVVDNKYPLATTDNDPQLTNAPEFDRLPPRSTETAARGLHEVVVATSDHATRLSTLTSQHWRRMLTAWRARIERAREIGLGHAAAFMNYGSRAGASLAHLHGQLLAVDGVPVDVQRRLEAFDGYARANHDACLLCDRLEHLESHRDRWIDANAGAVAFAPFASRFPFEICVAPRRHRTALRAGQSPADPEIPAVASMLTETLRRLDHVLNDPPLNLMVQTAPLTNRDERFHWHIDILPALSRGAGFEWSTGWHVNPVSPETAATRLREAEPADINVSDDET